MVRAVKRLYELFQPEHYELELYPNRDSMTFSGKVNIRGRKIGRPSKRITLHQKGLKVSSAKLFKIEKKTGRRAIKIERINTQKSFDELRLHADETLFPGNYELEVSFSGKITDSLHGIYPCYFESRKKQLIATQFESHHAREAFPCIDEPEAKATFALTLTSPAGEMALSNTPIKSQKKSGGLLTTTFETTPVMSTYLLAFAYGEAVFKQSKTKNGVIVRSYATPQNAKLLDFSLDCAVRTVEFFEEYFDTPYPLPKLDLIALPDFSVGAMENWGLITFRESVMLADPKNSAIETKQFIAMVVAHEVAHMWFGDLVTMKWWDDLWLNESFANLMEYRAVDELFPEWKIWEEFVNREIGGALRRDALPNVQPLRATVRHPDELNALFDPSIVYAKGGSLLHMVMRLIGEEAFTKGLKDYFEKHKYANSQAEDLWSALGASAKMDISGLMKNWLTKPGYPVVDIDYDFEKAEFSASQKRLVIGTDNKHDHVWKIPLAVTADLAQPILMSKSGNFKVKSKTKDLLLDHDGHSYFVPRYVNKTHFAAILDSIKNNKLSVIDRLQILQHSLLLQKAGLIGTTDCLELIAVYKAEEDESVWGAIAAILGEARALAAGDKKAEDDMDAFIRPLVQPLVKKIGWNTKPNDSAKVLRLRGLILALAVGASLPSAVAEASQRFKKLKKPSDIAPDIREVVYFAAARHGSQADFSKLVELYKSIENADERVEISYGLTATKDAPQVRQLLTMMMTDDVRKQDTGTWYALLIRNYYARAETWNWLVKNWAWIEKNFGGDKRYDDYPRYAGSAFSTPEDMKRYKQFFTPKTKDISLERPVALGLEEISGRVAWRKKNEAETKGWLATQRIS